MRLFNQFLFTPSAGTATLNTTEAPVVYNMPAVDPSNVDTTIANGSTGAVFVGFGGVGAPPAVTVPPNTTVLLQANDNGPGFAASTATEITIAGRSQLTVTRGTATAQQIFADR